jgi:signal transduction histidine kinase/predicted CoA-binding protein
VSNDFLRKVPLFADLPEADLDRLCEAAGEVVLEPGETLFREGDSGDRAYIIRDGELEIVKRSGDREILLAVRRRGEVIGELALLDESPRMASARARSRTTMLTIGKEQLDDLLECSASAARAMFHTVLARWNSTESMLRQSEKMAQLGTFTAGVAHELNNPAAAVQRGAGQLQEAIDAFGSNAEALGRAGVSLEGLPKPAPAGDLDPVTRSDREEDIEDLLSEHGVKDPFEMAPALVELGYDRGAVEELAERFDGDALSAVLGAISGSFTVSSLLGEIGHGAGRIAEIVKALKSYSYMDRAPAQLVDVHEGLDSTLVILRHKLKAGIEIQRDYADDLPRIEAYGSELNQVWTNLIDNAADALGEAGKIRLHTEHEEGWVVVTISDDGPGIPESVKGRIFEPFVTTKPPGKGTGLGLDISYRIVVQRHRGDIEVFSEPGCTCFEVRLPVSSRGADEAGAMAAIHRPEDDELRRILISVQTVAVVGISAHAETPAYSVPSFLQSKGYRILPVNPNLDEMLGEPAHAELAAVSETVDCVLVFRRSQFVPDIVDASIDKRVKVIWMQDGIVHRQAAERARRAGIDVVMDTCIRNSWNRLLSGE